MASNNQHHLEHKRDKKSYKGAMSKYATKEHIKKESKKTLTRSDASYIISSYSNSD